MIFDPFAMNLPLARPLMDDDGKEELALGSADYKKIHNYAGAPVADNNFGIAMYMFGAMPMNTIDLDPVEFYILFEDTDDADGETPVDEDTIINESDEFGAIMFNYMLGLCDY